MMKKRRKIISFSDDEESQDNDNDIMLSDDGYDNDLIGDEKDRKKMSEMTEIQRESVLFERAEKRRERLERQAAQRELLEEKKKKEKENSQPDRRKRYKKMIAERAKSEKMIGVDIEEGHVTGSDEEDEKDSEKEKLNILPPGLNNLEAIPNRTETELTYNKFRDLQIRRVVLEKCVNEPWFSDYVIGKFARVAIGTTNDNHSDIQIPGLDNISRPQGTTIYRVAEIIGIEDTSRKYKLGNVMTKLALVLRYGKSERIFKMEMISNHHITEDEFNSWLAVMKESKKHILSNEEATSKKMKAERMRKGYVYDGESVANIIESKVKTQSLRFKNIAREKSLQMESLARAQAEGNEKEIREATTALTDLNEFELKKIKNQDVRPILAIASTRTGTYVNTSGRDTPTLSRPSSTGVTPAARNPFSRKPTRPTIPWTGTEPESNNNNNNNNQPMETSNDTSIITSLQNDVPSSPIATITKNYFNTNNSLSIHSQIQLDIDLSVLEKTDSECPKVPLSRYLDILPVSTEGRNCSSFSSFLNMHEYQSMKKKKS